MIGDPERCGGRLIDEEVVREVPMDVQSPHTLFRQQPGQYDQAQHHGQQEVEQIIAGVDGGDPDGQGQQQETDAFCCHPDGAVPEQPAEQSLEVIGCHADGLLPARPHYCDISRNAGVRPPGGCYTGTGTVSRMS